MNFFFFFRFRNSMASNKKVSFVDDIPETTSGKNENMDPETAKKLFEIGATLFLVKFISFLFVTNYLYFLKSFF